MERGDEDGKGYKYLGILETGRIYELRYEGKNKKKNISVE